MFYTGAFKQPKDERDYPYEVMGSFEIDWDKGFDIRDKIGNIPIKNQMHSNSCVSQGWSYQVGVYEALETGIYKDVSPKSIYPFIALPNGGAYIREGAKRVSNIGSLLETIVPSYKPDGTTDEKFMRQKDWWNDEMEKKAKILRGKEYRSINIHKDFDLLARAIEENNGVVGGLYVGKGLKWGTERPQPSTNTGGHCLFFGAYGKDKYGKFIATPNSWGKRSWMKDWAKGKVGIGWQKIYENYLPYMFDPWTYTDIKDNNMLKLIKGVNSPEIYLLDYNGIKHHISSPNALEELFGTLAWKNIDVMPQKEVDEIVEGKIITIKKDGLLKALKKLIQTFDKVK